MFSVRWIGGAGYVGYIVRIVCCNKRFVVFAEFVEYVIKAGREGEHFYTFEQRTSKNYMYIT